MSGFHGVNEGNEGWGKILPFWWASSMSWWNLREWTSIKNCLAKRREWHWGIRSFNVFITTQFFYFMDLDSEKSCKMVCWQLAVIKKKWDQCVYSISWVICHCPVIGHQTDQLIKSLMQCLCMSWQSYSCWWNFKFPLMTGVINISALL